MAMLASTLLGQREELLAYIRRKVSDPELAEDICVCMWE